MPAKKQDLYPIEVTEKQLGLHRLIASMQNGKIEGIVVQNGEPVVVTASTLRIDFQRSEELAKVLKFKALDLHMGDEIPIEDPTAETDEKDTADQT